MDKKQEALDYHSGGRKGKIEVNTENPDEVIRVCQLPDLTSGNICYKLLNRLGGADAIGPILMGMKKPIHVLQRGDDVANIVNMAAIAVVDAQNPQRKGV